MLKRVLYSIGLGGHSEDFVAWCSWFHVWCCNARLFEDPPDMRRSRLVGATVPYWFGGMFVCDIG